MKTALAEKGKTTWSFVYSLAWRIIVAAEESFRCYRFRFLFCFPPLSLFHERKSIPNANFTSSNTSQDNPAAGASFKKFAVIPLYNPRSPSLRTMSTSISSIPICNSLLAWRRCFHTIVSQQQYYVIIIVIIPTLSGTQIRYFCVLITNTSPYRPDNHERITNKLSDARRAGASKKECPWWNPCRKSGKKPERENKVTIYTYAIVTPFSIQYPLPLASPRPLLLCPESSNKKWLIKNSFKVSNSAMSTAEYGRIPMRAGFDPR